MTNSQQMAMYMKENGEKERCMGPVRLHMLTMEIDGLDLGLAVLGITPMDHTLLLL